MNAATANGRPKPSLGANATWAFVWSVWLLLLAADLWALSGTSRNVPIGEDWFVVSAFTGNQPDFSSWLWSQNNEHRVPLPRLIMVAMLRLTHGELRSVQVLNILLIAAVAAAFIRKAVSLRDGRYAFSDAVFPLVALHFGHSENMLWAWQITFVCSFVLISIILLQMVDKTGLRSPRAALIGGGALVLLPLTGATGLLFVPLLNGWFIVSGLMQTRRGGEERRAGFILLAAGALTLLVSLIYFVDYEVPPHGATRLPFAQAVRSAALAASFGFGPAARVLDMVTVPLAVLLMIGTGALLIRRLRKSHGTDRQNTVGLAVFFAASAGYLLALGYTRGSTAIFDFRLWPLRYALMAAPMMYCCQFIWNLSGERAARVGLGVVTVALLVLVPFNTAQGRIWSNWFREGADKLLADIHRGVTPSELAATHRGFIPTWLDRAEPVRYLQMLKNAGVKPYHQLRMDPPRVVESLNMKHLSQPADWVWVDFTYSAAGVTEAALLWGVDGWQNLPKEVRPADTMIENNAMQTILVRSGGKFLTRLQVPRGSTLDFGIVITKCGEKVLTPTWDDLHPAVTPGSTDIRVDSPLRCDETGTVVYAVGATPVTNTIHYVHQLAGEAWLVWGVNGWHPVESRYRNDGIITPMGSMAKIMKRTTEGFTADVTVPEGATINYGVLVTRRGCCMGLSSFVWDVPPNAPASSGEPIMFRSSTPMPDESARFLPGPRQAAAAVAGLIGLTAFLMCAAFVRTKMASGA